MAPYYRLVVAANVLPLDQSLLDKLEKENTTELERLDKVLKEAEETESPRARATSPMHYEQRPATLHELGKR
jgi:hypothetical protein